jgi:hypothetical protein
MRARGGAARARVRHDADHAARQRGSSIVPTSIHSAASEPHERTAVRT